MRPAVIDSMSPAMPDFAAGIVHIEQRPSRRSSAVWLTVLLVIGALMLFPFYLLVSTAWADSGLRDAAATRPLATLQIAVGLSFWLLLIGFPIYRAIDALSRGRTVTIDGRTVAVEDRSFGRTTRWSASLDEFRGLAPYLRASLSGVRHELILVHPDRDRSVLVALADRLHQSDVDRITTALGRPELPPSAFHGRGPAARLSTVQPAAAAV